METLKGNYTMKVYTQEEFDALPEVKGIKQCPKGDYSAVRVFSTRCSFAAGSRFGSESSFKSGCIFGSLCVFGDKCIFGNFCEFGSWCSFGAECHFGVKSRFGSEIGFGDRCVFSKESRFGADCRFGEKCIFNGGCARQGYPLLALSGAGSVNRTVYAFNVKGGPMIEAGCFYGTLDEFREKVRGDDGGKLKKLQYLTFANIVAATWCPKKVEIDTVNTCHRKQRKSKKLCKKAVKLQHT
jgi:hypothetical protein